MESVPDFDPFFPAGLPSYVGEGRLAPTASRSDICGGSDGCEDSDALVFALHTIDIRDGDLVSIPIVDANNEAEIRSQISEANRVAADRAQMAFDEKARNGDYSDNSVEHASCFAYLTGQTNTGWKVGFVVPFRPFFEVELEPTSASKELLQSHLGSLAYSLRMRTSDIGVFWHTGCRFKGYVPDPEDPLKRKTFLYARLSFPNAKIMDQAARRLRDGVFRRGGSRTSFVVYEDRIDIDQKFVDAFNLTPSGWHSVPKCALDRVSASGRHMLVNDEYFVSDPNVRFTPVDTILSVPPMIIASIDAEMNGTKPNRFPKAHRDTDAVVVVGVVFALAGGTNASLEGVEFERQAFVLGRHCDPIDGVIVRLYDDELEMIAAVRDELFVRKMVDVVAGHNIVKFDMAYLATRIQRSESVNPSAKRFLRFGCLITESLKLKDKQLSSAGMGANKLQLLFGAGFAYVDTMLLCKQYHKLRENTLSFASSVFLSSNKFEMPYTLIPSVVAGEDPAHWRLLTAYCVQDCLLVLRLMKKWDSIKDLVAQSRVINIPMAVNLVCGQQQRVRDSLMKKARTMNMVMNGVNERKEVSTENVSAEGGWVIESVAGFHDKPVVVLDFASLYPSVQREHNLCWSTVIDDISIITDAHRAAGLIVKTYETATGTYHIASNVPGVFPLQLKDLLMARRQYKKEMESAEYGSAEYQNADAKQKATKIVMNSGYGTANCEEGKGIMPCKAVGTITCFEGRKLNQRADSFCKSDPRFQTETLYGDTDSIMVHFPEEALYAKILSEKGREPTRKERLEYAMEKGFEAEHVLNEEVFRSDVIKTECEKVYFPYRPRCKKAYAGLKWEPKDVKNASDNLERPDKSIGRTGGTIEAKGMRAVRRDVPLFIKEMTQKLLDTLFYDRDLDAFWDIVHCYTEKVVHLDIPLPAFELTKELKDNYWLQENVSPHIAVSYAREYANPGSGFVEGDRVGFVIVEEADPRRIIKPKWLNCTVVPDAADVDEGSKETLDCKRSMCARHIDEVYAHPDQNHIDVVFYVEMGICSVLAQLMPDDEDAQKELVAYAKRAQALYKSNRPSGSKSLHMFMDYKELSREEIEAMLPKLSHRRPSRRAAVADAASVMGMFDTCAAAPVRQKRSNADIKKSAAKRTAIAARQGSMLSFTD